MVTNIIIIFFVVFLMWWTLLYCLLTEPWWKLKLKLWQTITSKTTPWLKDIEVYEPKYKPKFSGMKKEDIHNIEYFTDWIVWYDKHDNVIYKEQKNRWARWEYEHTYKASTKVGDSSEHKRADETNDIVTSQIVLYENSDWERSEFVKGKEVFCLSRDSNKCLKRWKIEGWKRIKYEGWVLSIDWREVVPKKKK